VKSGIAGLVGALAVAIAACHGHDQATTPAPAPAPVANSAPPPASPTLEAELTPAPDDPMAMMQLFSDQVCACHDKPCADDVVDHMVAWGQEMAQKSTNKTAAVAKEDAAKIASLSEKLARCLTAIAAAAINAQGAP
jgi:hypothetical protein